MIIAPRGDVRIPGELSGIRGNQDLRDVCVKKVLTSGRSALPPHCGHTTLALSCSLIVRVIRTSARHLSQ